MLQSIIIHTGYEEPYKVNMVDYYHGFLMSIEHFIECGHESVVESLILEMEVPKEDLIYVAKERFYSDYLVEFLESL